VTPPGRRAQAQAIRQAPPRGPLHVFREGSRFVVAPIRIPGMARAKATCSSMPANYPSNHVSGRARQVEFPSHGFGGGAGRRTKQAWERVRTIRDGCSGGRAGAFDAEVTDGCRVDAQSRRLRGDVSPSSPRSTGPALAGLIEVAGDGRHLHLVWSPRQRGAVAGCQGYACGWRGR